MAIKVLGIAPYPGLCDVLIEMAAVEDRIEIEVEIANLDEALPLAKRAEQAGYDVIVSRGGTASLIREHVALPVVEIAVSGYDILRVLTLIKDANSKVAIIGFQNICQGAATISNLLDFDIPIYPISHESEVRTALQQAIENNVQLVLGDVVTVQAAQEMGYHGILIVSGRESVQEAFGEVMRVHELYQQGLSKAHFHQAVLQQIPIAVLAVDGVLQVRYLNSAAEQLLGIRSPAAHGQPIGRYSPDLERFLTQTGEQKTSSEKIRVQGQWLDVQVAESPEPAFAETILYLQSTVSAIAGKQGGLPPAPRIETFAQIIGSSPLLQHVVERAKAFAKVEQNVWLTGPKGSGRGLFAKAIHAASARSAANFAWASCTLPTEQLERLLFGDAKEPGILTTTTGTLYLSEIDHLPQQLQKRLLQALRAGIQARLLVSSEPLPADWIEANDFMPELFYALNELHLPIPPLSSRPEDIEDIVRVWMAAHNSQYGKQIVGLRPEVLQRLQQHDWPGNIKELQNVVAEMLTLTKGHFVTLAEADAVWERYRLPNCATACVPTEAGVIDLSGSWEDIEQRILLQVLQEEGMNQSQAAKRLGLHRSTLWRKLHNQLQQD